MSPVSWGDIFTLPLGGDKIMELRQSQPADFFRLPWAAAGAGSTARAGGFLEAAAFSLPAMLLRKASIRSMTGAILGCGASATSRPSCLAAIMAFMLSWYSSLYLPGSKGAARLLI